MDRTHAVDAVAVKPAYSEDGVAGFHDDGTTVLAQVLNQLIEEQRNVLVAAGLTPSALSDTQLVEALSGALAAVGHATDTGTVTTPKTRTVIASTSSKATGGNSAVIASATSEALNGYAHVFASLLSKVLSLGGVIGGSGECWQAAAAIRSVMLASLGCENVEPYTVVLGYSTDPLTPSGSNQNRQIILRAITGDIELVGELSAGGNVIGANVQSLGDLQVVDDASVNGDLAVGGVANLGDIEVPGGSNEVSDRLTGPISIAAGSHADIVVYNSRVDAGSRIFYSLTIVGGGADDAPLTSHIYGQADGGFTVRLQNPGAGAFAQTTYVDYWILNPKPAA
jgi:hypothetical protein